MAYVFDKIDSLMGDEEKNNVFQQPQGDQPQQTDQAVTKTTTEGGAVPEAQSSATAPAVKSSQGGAQDTGTPGGQAFYEAQAGKVKPQGMFSGSLEGVKEAEKNLRSAAESYATADYNIPEYDIKGAIAGDESQMANVRNILTPQETQVESFEAPEFDFSGVESLLTGEGVKQSLMKDRGPDYTGGEAAYDYMLMSKSPEFQAQQKELEGALGAYKNVLGTLPGQLESGRRADIERAREQEAKKIMDALRAEERALLNQNLEEMRAEEARRKGVYEEASRGLEDMIQSYGGVTGLGEGARMELTPEYVQSAIDEIGTPKTPEDAARLEQLQGLLRQLTPQSLDPGQFVDQIEADKFNRILEMMIAGGASPARTYYSAGAGPGEYGLDLSTYEDTLRDLAAQAEEEQAYLDDPYADEEYGLWGGPPVVRDTSEGQQMVEIPLPGGESTYADIGLFENPVDTGLNNELNFVEGQPLPDDFQAILNTLSGIDPMLTQSEKGKAYTYDLGDLHGFTENT